LRCSYSSDSVAGGHRGKRAGDVGVEHAAPAAIARALRSARPVHTSLMHFASYIPHLSCIVLLSCIVHQAAAGRATLTAHHLRERGLVAALVDPLGQPRWMPYGGVKERRRLFGGLLGIGDTNGNTLLLALNTYGFSLEEVDAAVAAIPLKAQVL
jgi:hypothetical protein